MINETELKLLYCPFLSLTCFPSPSSWLYAMHINKVFTEDESFPLSTFKHKIPGIQHSEREITSLPGRQNKLISLLKILGFNFFLVEFKDLKTLRRYLFSFDDTVFSIWKICSLISIKNEYI